MSLLFLYSGCLPNLKETKFEELTTDFKILPLLNKGFVYAIAHVRGGSFLGKSWYDDGKLLNKIAFSVFTSLISLKN